MHPALTLARQAGILLTYPRRREGWSWSWRLLMSTVLYCCSCSLCACHCSSLFCRAKKIEISTAPMGLMACEWFYVTSDITGGGDWCFWVWFFITSQIKFDFRLTDLRSTWCSESIVNQLCFSIHFWSPITWCTICWFTVNWAYFMPTGPQRHTCCYHQIALLLVPSYYCMRLWVAWWNIFVVDAVWRLRLVKSSTPAMTALYQWNNNNNNCHFVTLLHHKMLVTDW